MTLVDRHAFGKELADRSVEYRDEPFRLKHGGESHWYVDVRSGLSRGEMLSIAGRLVVEDIVVSRYEVVAGIGIAGNALVTAVGIHTNMGMAWGNENKADEDPKNDYGLHGAEVRARRVLGVDDTATSGESLRTLASMVLESGGIIEDMVVLVDRSNGLAANAVRALGLGFHAIYKFDEETGLLVPTGFAS